VIYNLKSKHIGRFIRLLISFLHDDWLIFLPNLRYRNDASELCCGKNLENHRAEMFEVM
jgi:hypothetical protein